MKDFSNKTFNDAVKLKRMNRSTMFIILFVLFTLLVGITAGLTYAGFQSTATSNGTLSFAVNGHKGQISISNCDVRYDTSTLTNTFTILPNANYSVPSSISTYILTTEPTASNWINAPTGWTLNNTITTYSAGTITVDDLAMISANAKAIYISGECTASTYTITYNANGGSGTMSASTPNYGSQFTLKANSFTRTGYTFAGWSTTANGVIEYSDSTKVKDIGNTTLYAKWTGNKYLINFDNQGADISMGTIATIVSYGSALPSITIPTRTGYTFSGYYTAINGGGTQYYTASGTSAVSYSQTSNTTLYAKWTISSYTITVNVDSTNSYGSVNTTSFSVNHGTKIYANGTTLRQDTFTGTTKSIATPSTNNAQYTYSFTKWRGDELDIPSGNYITITGAITITAHFGRILNQYTITINARSEKVDGTLESTTTGGTVSGSGTYNYGTNIKNQLSYSLATGFNFSGYFTNSGCTTALSDSATITGNITVYAKFMRKTYALTLNKGTGIASVTGAGTYKYGASVNISATAATGYTWANWSVTSGNTPANVSSASTTLIITQATTLQANATVNRYTLEVWDADYNVLEGYIYNVAYGSVITFYLTQNGCVCVLTCSEGSLEVWNGNPLDVVGLCDDSGFNHRIVSDISRGEGDTFTMPAMNYTIWWAGM